MGRMLLVLLLVVIIVGILVIVVEVWFYFMGMLIMGIIGGLVWEEIIVGIMMGGGM